MRKLMLTGMLLLPAFAAQTDHGTTYGTAGLAPQFLFDIDEDNAVGLLVEAGAQGYYRGNLTYAAQAKEQHWFKFSGEYLIEHQDANFVVDPRQIWVDQYAMGGTYQYFPSVKSPIAFLANTYGSYTPSEDVNETQRIAEAIAYGGNIGFDAFFPTKTQIEAALRYDVVTFHQSFSPDEKEEGFGGSGFIKQYFGCDYNAIAGADFTSIYNNYYAAFNILIPAGSQAVELGVKGQYNDPHDNLTRTLIGFVTIGLQPLQNCHPKATQTRETLASFASRPAVYMPTVLAKADQSLEPTFGPVFIPGTHWTSPANTYDISPFFAGFGPGPITYALVITSPAPTQPGHPTAAPGFFPAAGVINTGNLPVDAVNGKSFSGYIVATNAEGGTATSNVFTVSYTFP